jgi:hypothetical protein
MLAGNGLLVRILYGKIPKRIITASCGLKLSETEPSLKYAKTTASAIELAIT